MAQPKGRDGGMQQPRPPFKEQEQEPPGLDARMEPRPRYQAPRYKGSGKLEGKRALVTGGDSGIGRAVCVLFAREGADVAFIHLPPEREDADTTVDAVQKEGRQAFALEGDVSDYVFCKEAVARVVDRFGGLDILVNNAAVQEHVHAVEELSVEHWQRTFEVNIHGYFYMVKAALPHLGEGSAIINSGSITGLEGSGGLLDYASTKGAIHAFTKSLAQMLVKRGIRVNCVAPGPVWTPLQPQERPGKDVAKFGADTAMGRPAQPEEVAPAYVFFASHADSSYVTGEVLTLLGGETRAA